MSRLRATTPGGITPAAPVRGLPSRRPRVWLFAIACAAALSLLSGCTTTETGYKVLTFFFTGVPPMGQKEAPEDAVKVVVARAAPSRVQVVKSTRFGHGPYVANLCFECHEVSASGGFRGFGAQKEAAGSIAAAGAVSGKLVAPMGELCSSCHESKSPTRAQQAGLSVHGPVSTGYCILCHAPHAGQEGYLLALKTNALCSDCHTVETIATPSVHKGKGDCISCHNAHFGKDHNLLTADYREPW